MIVGGGAKNRGGCLYGSEVGVSKKTKKLRDNMWKLTREIVFERNGHRECELCRSEVGIQIDHCFSRRISILFFDLSNLTALCNSCHFKKSYHQGSVEAELYEHVRRREGKEYKRIKKVAGEGGAFPEISRIWWLEEKFNELKELYHYYRSHHHEAT